MAVFNGKQACCTQNVGPISADMESRGENMVQVIVKRSTKKAIDLTKLQATPKPKTPPKNEPKPVMIWAASKGPPIAAELLEKHRELREPVQKPLNPKQIEALDRVIQKAGDDNDPKTLGLRLVLAAAHDEYAGAWPIGLLAKALHASGRPEMGTAIHRVAVGCRTARFGDMAAAALALLETKDTDVAPSRST
jgi:hypothetical protein